jgi:hypothetical protein
MNCIYDLKKLEKVERINDLMERETNTNYWLKLVSTDNTNPLISTWFKGIIKYNSSQFVIFQTEEDSKEYVSDLTKEQLLVSKFDETNNAIKELESIIHNYEDETRILLETKLTKIKSADRLLQNYTLNISESNKTLFTGLKNGTAFLKNITIPNGTDLVQLNVQKDIVVTASFLIPIIEFLRKENVAFVEMLDFERSLELSRAVSRISIRTKF